MHCNTPSVSTGGESPCDAQSEHAHTDVQFNAWTNLRLHSASTHERAQMGDGACIVGSICSYNTCMCCTR